MPTKINLILTSRALYESLQGYFEDQTGEIVHTPKGFQVDQFSINLIGDPEGDQNSQKSGMEAQVEDGEGDFVYIDKDYTRLKTHTKNGLRSAWVNQDVVLAPDRLPVYDVDIQSFDELTDMSASLKKPSLSQCLAWWEEWDLPDNIRQHATMVAWLAYVLGVMLRMRGINLDPILAHRGGLLHDLDKIQTLDKSMGHGEMGAEFLKSKGYLETAEIVRGHIMHTILHPNADDRSWETKLVFFVDKLVEGDRLVPFDVRLAALKERYPDYREVMARAEAGVWGLNDTICEILSISSHEDLIAMLQSLLVG